MKLHRLELAGFGPFRERQVVDFDAFDGDGVFLISGRTGAGKSSILDGVSFALYGVVPRYDGGERRLRSDHCFVDDPSEVVLEFTVGATRWRVTRAPEYERPSRRGDKLVTEAHRAEVEEFVDGRWITRAAKPREAGLLLDDVLGLNAVQFQQVILLAQNRFSRFLLAKNDERQALLRTLFGTKRFEDYKNELIERRKTAQQKLGTSGEHARTLLDEAELLIDEHALHADGATDTSADESPDPETPARDGDLVRPAGLAQRRAAADTALVRADYRVEVRAQEKSAADAAHAAAVDAHTAIVARAKTRAALADASANLRALEARGAEIDEARHALERARAAETLRSAIDAADRAAAAHAVAEADAVAARTRWSAARGEARTDLPADVSTADLSGIAERLTGEVAVWSAAVAHERALADRERDHAETEEQIARLREQIDDLDAQRAHVPAEREALESELAGVRDTAARCDDLRDAHETVQQRLAAARDAEALAETQRAAEAEYARLSDAAARAASDVAALLRARLSGYAGELSAALVPGEPCAVCGATDHPHPAPSAPDAVTDDDVAAAETAREAAVAAEREGAEGARTARDAHAAARARAGGRDAAALTRDLEEAAAALAVAEQAVRDRGRLRAALAELAERDEAAAASRDALATALATHRESAAAQSAEISAMRRDVDAARGEHDTVAERVAAATVLRDAARACVVADDALAERARAVRVATNDRDELIADSVFDDASEASAALVDDAARSDLASRIAEHADRLAAAKARVFDLELDAAGDDGEDLDIAAAAAERDASDAARSAAIAAERDAARTAQTLRSTLARADAAYAALAGLEEDARVVTRLADTVAGRAPNTMKMDLETFVLAAELEEIVAAANLRLTEMSSGRYTLHQSDARSSRGAASGLGIAVLDAHTNQLRSPQSLSGGETFLASLALALGLAEVVTGRAGGLRLDTLFVDEGFGSLDPETLEMAMDTLDDLRAGGRTVGVISHVEGMASRITARLVVDAPAQGPSIIRQGADAVAPVALT